MDQEEVTHRSNVAVVFIDIQDKLQPAIHDGDQVLANSIKVAQFCDRLGIPVIVTEQYPKGLGQTKPELQEALGDGYAPIAKTEFSCFGCQEFVDKIAEMDLDVIAVCGMETHICVLQTVLAPLESQELEVMVLADCVGSRTPLNHQLGLDRMRDEGAIISSMEMFFYEYLGKAKTDEHKAVFDLLK
ncbi:MAG: isochorismatase family protein [Deltaproteobacteria bacterium]|nr:isochorismatase family protein [bacterium]MCB9477805.1 isochorismatase family protein [Deltaproteobacteria bacterium]MCB9487831.1 isochorismatase family protein [Deltaproteobacteria bacterium]